MNLTLPKKHNFLIALLAMASSIAVAQQGFTWIKGPSVTGVPGAYGALGISSATNNPGCRQGAASWKDASGDFWLFGGQGKDNIGNYGYLNDLWKYTPANNQWTWISGTNVASQAGVYGTQGAPSVTNNPGSRSHGAAWQDATGKVYIFGGIGYDAFGGFGYLNDLWKYDPVNNQWTWLKGSNTYYQAGVYGTISVSSATTLPGARMGSGAWSDASGNFWLWGGRGNSTSSLTIGYLNDLWRYTVSTNEWTWMQGGSLLDQSGVYGTGTSQLGVASNTVMPGSRMRGMSWQDSSGDFWLFGGEGYDSVTTATGELNDLWKYSTTTGNWTWMKGGKLRNQAGIYGAQGVAAATNNPGGRDGAVTWTDAANNLWLGFGNGYGLQTSTPGKLSDMWIYNVSSNTWKWVYGPSSVDLPGVYGTIGTPAATNLPGSRRYSTGWIDATNNLYLMGGFGQASTATPAELSDLWKFVNCYISPVTLTISTSNTLVCAGESVTLSVSGAGTYTWNNSSISASIIVNPTVTSQYVATTTNTNSCRYSTTFTQSIDACTSVKNVQAENNISLYPNPNKGSFMIDSNEPGFLQVINSIGQVIFEHQLDTVGRNAVTANLSAGVYYCRIKNVTGRETTGKLIIE